MSVAFLAIVTLFVTVLYVTKADLASDRKQGRPVCSTDFDEDQSMADFRKFANAPAEIEKFLGKTLADDDHIIRYEVHHTNPQWIAMFVNVTEKASGESHFISLSRRGDRWIPITIKEEEFKKWKTVCTL